MATAKRFGYTGSDRTCFWCGEKLKLSRVWTEPGGNMNAAIVEALRVFEIMHDRPPEGPIKHPQLGWISGSKQYPRQWEGLVRVGPRGADRQASAGKAGTCEEDDHFCSGGCCEAFGRRAAELGYRLEMQSSEETEK